MSQLPGYVLSQPTATRVKQLVAAAPDTAGTPVSGIAARQVGWVRVTSGTAVSGWYPAVVTTLIDGTWTDATDTCEVQGSNAETLTSGKRYWCERTGESGSGTMRYVVQVGGSTPSQRSITYVTGVSVSCSGGTLVSSVTTATANVFNP